MSTDCQDNCPGCNASGTVGECSQEVAVADAEIKAEVSKLQDLLRKEYMRANDAIGRENVLGENYRLTVAELKEARKAIEQARALHTKYDDSEHCQHDGEPWPCPTVRALEEARTGGF